MTKKNTQPKKKRESDGILSRTVEGLASILHLDADISFWLLLILMPIVVPVALALWVVRRFQERGEQQ